MSRIAKRGAEVKFTEPNWVKELGGIEAINKNKDQSKKDQDE